MFTVIRDFLTKYSHLSCEKEGTTNKISSAGPLINGLLVPSSFEAMSSPRWIHNSNLPDYRLQKCACGANKFMIHTCYHAHPFTFHTNNQFLHGLEDELCKFQRDGFISI